MNDPVLVTGCSSGIGRAVALALLERGHTVYATARRPETLADLEAKGAHVFSLDVTNEASMKTVVAEIEAEHGAVGTLVNNAGYAQYGPFETVPLADARAQLETNVFGLARLAQLVLPGMRKAGRGRILNVSSMGGRLTFPLGAWYHVSKHAVEGLSDVMRQELRSFGIDVVIIEPGPVRSEFNDTLHSRYSGAKTGPYAALEAEGAELFDGVYDSRWAITPEKAARAFVRAVEARRPRHRYLGTVTGKTSVHLRRLLGSRAWDALVRSQFRTAARRIARREAKAGA
jgi:NAD(P)-dependent dehydrogenase (short-subunit alcohol dehydrogenase family)